VEPTANWVTRDLSNPRNVKVPTSRIQFFSINFSKGRATSIFKLEGRGWRQSKVSDETDSRSKGERKQNTNKTRRGRNRSVRIFGAVRFFRPEWKPESESNFVCSFLAAFCVCFYLTLRVLSLLAWCLVGICSLRCGLIAGLVCVVVGCVLVVIRGRGFEVRGQGQLTKTHNRPKAE
jgi:hypothetical protein